MSRDWAPSHFQQEQRRGLRSQFSVLCSFSSILSGLCSVGNQLPSRLHGCKPLLPPLAVQNASFPKAPHSNFLATFYNVLWMW